MPIDFFLRSLGADVRERGIGIVLSGTGTDGTLGLRAIKAAGGLAIAQDPATAEHDGMRRKDIAADVQDYRWPGAGGTTMGRASRVPATIVAVATTSTTSTTITTGTTSTTTMATTWRLSCVTRRTASGDARESNPASEITE